MNSSICKDGSLDKERDHGNLTVGISEWNLDFWLISYRLRAFVSRMIILISIRWNICSQNSQPIKRVEIENGEKGEEEQEE